MRALLVGVGGCLLVVAIAFVAYAGNLEAPGTSPANASAAVADVRDGRGLAAAVAGLATPSPTVPAVLSPPPSGPAPASRGMQPPARASAAALLMDDASGAVLFEHNAHAQLAPASLTKIATAVVAIERGDLDAAVESDVDSRAMLDDTVMGLLPGDRFSLRDLLYGLMLPSGNDAAIVIGRYIAGSDPAFVDEMNELASRLGLRDTHFANAHGLAAIAHYSSAYDLAVLSRYAMTLPSYREIASADTWTAHGSRDIPLYSLVTQVRQRVEGADAGKSGYTRAAGRTLVMSAQRDGHRLYAVVLNDEQTEADAAALLDWGFANFDWGQAVASAQPPPTPPTPPTPSPSLTPSPTEEAASTDESHTEALRTND